jgi:hypothetical protein
MSSLLQDLAMRPGTYWGLGSGPESGDFVGRLEIAPLGDGVRLGYEAWSPQQGLQHREETLLTAEPDGRLLLHVATAESEPVLTFAEEGAGAFVAGDLRPLRIVVELPEIDTVVYAWWWPPQGGRMVEQSRLVARRVA